MVGISNILMAFTMAVYVGWFYNVVIPTGVLIHTSEDKLGARLPSDPDLLVFNVGPIQP